MVYHLFFFPSPSILPSLFIFTIYQFHPHRLDSASTVGPPSFPPRKPAKLSPGRHFVVVTYPPAAGGA